MNQKDREAMQMALDSLELALTSHGKLLLSDPPQDAWKIYGVENKSRNTIAALRERLSQPEPEPVAWSVLNKRTGKHWYTNESRETSQYYANEYSHREPDGSPSMVVTPLYTAPPKREWVGLTKEEVYGIANTAVGKTFTDMTREIEAKLKEKNT